MCYNTLNIINININRHTVTNTRRILDAYEEKNPYICISISIPGNVLDAHFQRFFLF